MAVEQKVKQIIVEQLGVDESQVDSNASFVDDLGADSLDIVELVMAFEEAFELEIPGRRRREDHHGERRRRIHREQDSQEIAAFLIRGSRFDAKSGSDRRRSADAAWHRNRSILGGDPRGKVRHWPHHAVRCGGFLVPHRRRGEGLRPRQLHREKRNQEDGAIHPLRRGGGGFRPQGFRLEGHSGDRRAGGRVHRQRYRRVRGDRARAQDPAGARAAAYLAVFHSGHHHQPGFGLRFHPDRRQGAEFRHRHGLHHQRPFHRRFLPHDSARRRRRHDLRRHGSRRHAHGDRRVRRHARAFHAQRRTGARVAPVGQGPRRLRGGRRRRHSGAGGTGNGARRAARRFWPKWWDMA